MIPVAAAAEPATFDLRVRRPGYLALAEMCGKTPKFSRTAGRPFTKLSGISEERDIPSRLFPDYWTRCLDDLMKDYDQICAYSGFRIHPVTGATSADHYLAKSRHWRRVYEWTNYRLCSSRLNARKGDLRGVLDPFQIRPGWFQLELLGFQVIPGPRLSKATRAKIQRTIDTLGLNDFRHDREKDATRYWSKDVSLKTLREDSPFVASELARQGRLNAGDVW